MNTFVIFTDAHKWDIFAVILHCNHILKYNELIFHVENLLGLFIFYLFKINFNLFFFNLLMIFLTFFYEKVAWLIIGVIFEFYYIELEIINVVWDCIVINERINELMVTLWIFNLAGKIRIMVEYLEPTLKRNQFVLLVIRYF